jgi:predicted anti-sigma-YlaC factor YlaD
MKCHKIQRLLPLLAGSELPERDIPDVKSHLERCPRCQAEYEAFVRLVLETRKWLEEERLECEEKEWQKTVQAALREGSSRRKHLELWPFWKGWAFAFMAGVMLLVTTLVIRPPFVKHIGLMPRYPDAAGMEVLSGSGGQIEQEMVSMTMVSKETGLQIVWIFNKNFDLEEKK